MTVEKQCANTQSEIPESDAPAPFDPFPARMVMFSLVVLGLSMLLLGILENEGRTILLSFAAVLLIPAGSIQLAIHRFQSRERNSSNGSR